MRSIAKLPLILLFAVSISVVFCGSAFAEKKFIIKKTGETSKSPLGENTITTPSGLMYKDIKVGTGASPKKNDVLWIHYVGWLPDGRKFRSTRDLGVPFNFIYGFRLMNPIGIEEGLANMKVGGKRLLLLPPALAYGSKGQGPDIPPDTTLKYEVELISIGPKRPK